MAGDDAVMLLRLQRAYDTGAGHRSSVRRWMQDNHEALGIPVRGRPGRLGLANGLVHREWFQECGRFCLEEGDGAQDLEPGEQDGGRGRQMFGSLLWRVGALYFVVQLVERLRERRRRLKGVVPGAGRQSSQTVPKWLKRKRRPI